MIVLFNIKQYVIKIIQTKQRVSNLIGKESSCQEGSYRIVADLTREINNRINKKLIRNRGKVAIGKARYLLNIVF